MDLRSKDFDLKLGEEVVKVFDVVGGEGQFHVGLKLLQ